MRTKLLITGRMPFTWVPDRQNILEVVSIVVPSPCAGLCDAHQAWNAKSAALIETTSLNDF